MNRSLTVLKYAQLLLLLLIISLSPTLAQDLEQQQFTMSYEGELLDAADNAVTASYAMTFRMYRDAGARQQNYFSWPR